MNQALLPPHRHSVSATQVLLLLHRLRVSATHTLHFCYKGVVSLACRTGAAHALCFCHAGSVMLHGHCFYSVLYGGYASSAHALFLLHNVSIS